MKKTYSEKELKEIADGRFAEFPAANTVFATVDGNVFLMENRARLHATPAGKVYPFYRPQESKEAETGDDTKTEEPKLNAGAAIAFIKAATTLEAIAPLADDTRATVKAAYDKRVTELTEQKEPATEAQTPTV